MSSVGSAAHVGLSWTVENDAIMAWGGAIDCGALGIVDGELTQRIAGLRVARLSRRCPRCDGLALSNRSDVAFGQVEAPSSDAMLAGEVVSVCWSAAYNRGADITSLHEALVRIGLSKLRGIVMQAAMSARVFRSKAYKACMEVLQEHCRVTAHLARLVSEQTSVDDERAFLCGLLHDVGIAGILTVLGDTKRGQEPPSLSNLWPAIDGAHTIAGSRMV
jgi:hypothetical protein